MWYAATYLGLVAVTSLTSFAAYGYDKRRATTGGRRVPERTLLGLALLGGWPGAIPGPTHLNRLENRLWFEATPSIAYVFQGELGARAEKTPKSP